MVPLDDGNGHMPVGDLPHTMPATLNVRPPHVALAIAAHPDDVDFGCGATLAKWAAGGCHLHVLVLTDGSKGSWDPAQDLAGLIDTRHREQRDALACLGGGVVEFLDAPDGELEAGLLERRRVCEVIRRVQPEVVLGHDPWRRYRLHPDHRNAGWLTTDAIVAARDPHFFADMGIEPHRPRALMLWEADEPNHVEDTTGYLDTKLAAITAHRSQHLSTLGIEPGTEAFTAGIASFRRRLKAQMAEHGALVGLGSGEAFRLIEGI